jgi:hypothetical protein
LLVHAFLLREQKEKREVELEKRDSICRRRARIPRQTASTDYKAADSIYYQSVQYGLERSYSIYCAQFSRQTAIRISGSIWHASQGYHKTIPGTEIEEVVGHIFLGEKSLYNPYGPAQKSRVVQQKISGHDFQGVGHVFQGICLVGFSIEQQQKFGTHFEDSPYSV